MGRRSTPPLRGIGRRGFLEAAGLAAVGGGGFLLGRGTAPANGQETAPPSEVADKALLNEILAASLGSRQRRKLEKTYVDAASTLAQIDAGFLALVTRNYRMELLDKRHDLRLGRHPGLPQLPQEIVSFVENYEVSYNSIPHHIHPEVVAISRDVYPKAREVIERLKPQLRPDMTPLALLRLASDDLMINPFGMAVLACYETPSAHTGYSDLYGFTYIGAAPALSQINPGAFPHAPQALEDLAFWLSQESGLSYKAENIPGSYRGDPTVNLSGGAIGLQFMPDKAVELHRLLRSVGVKFNPFDIESSLIAAWVFLARREHLSDNLIREGYMRNDDNQIRSALAKWNPYPSQINTVYNAAVAYYSDNMVGKPGAY